MEPSAFSLNPSELFPEVPNLYEFLSIHAGMLFDEERFDRYQEAIQSVVRPGDIVADIGTGTGLLAFMCLKAGARKVYAIERTPAIRWAKVLADRHGFSDRIEFYEDDSRSIELPERVDVVVSELIGHIAFEEGMVESLVDARQRFLAPGGVVIPEHVDLEAALVSEGTIYASYVECWGDFKGLDLSPLRADAVKQCYLTAIDSDELLSPPTTFFSSDLMTGEHTEVLESTRTLRPTRSGELNGVALWFNARLSPDVELSSKPSTKTHWTQCFAPIVTPIHVEPGDNVNVQLSLHLSGDTGAPFRFDMHVVKS